MGYFYDDGPEPLFVPRTLIHTAARRASFDDKGRDEELWIVNVGGTARVLEWALSMGVKRVILISGAVVYGDWSVPRREEDEPNPALAGHYAMSKWVAERIALAACNSHCELTILRLSSRYGAAFKSGLIRHFLGRAKTDGRIQVDPPIEDAFDLLHLSDAARTVANAVTSAKARTLECREGGALTSLLSVAGACEEATGAIVQQSRRRAQRKARILNWVDDSKARLDLGHCNSISLGTAVQDMAEG